MKKIFGTALVCAVLFGSFASLASARDDRPSRGEESSTPAPTPTPTPNPVPNLPNNNGSNGNNGANASSNTGGNNADGGTVITGDESVTVTVVNIGPTNNVPPPTNPPAPQPQPEPELDQCGERTCRTR